MEVQWPALLLWTGLKNLHQLVAEIGLLGTPSVEFIPQNCRHWSLEHTLGCVCSVPFHRLSSPVGPWSETWEEFEEGLNICQYYSLLRSKTGGPGNEISSNGLCLLWNFRLFLLLPRQSRLLSLLFKPFPHFQSLAVDLTSQTDVTGP